MIVALVFLSLLSYVIKSKKYVGLKLLLEVQFFSKSYLSKCNALLPTSDYGCMILAYNHWKRVVHKLLNNYKIQDVNSVWQFNF